MVEIEWDGIELTARERGALHERLHALSSAIDPEGRARLLVEIVCDQAGYKVLLDGGDQGRSLGAEVRDPDLRLAIQRAIDLAVVRWNDTREHVA